MLSCHGERAGTQPFSSSLGQAPPSFLLPYHLSHCLLLDDYLSPWLRTQMFLLSASSPKEKGQLGKSIQFNPLIREKKILGSSRCTWSFFWCTSNNIWRSNCKSCKTSLSPQTGPSPCFSPSFIFRSQCTWGHSMPALQVSYLNGEMLLPVRWNTVSPLYRKGSRLGSCRRMQVFQPIWDSCLADPLSWSEDLGIRAALENSCKICMMWKGGLRK